MAQRSRVLHVYREILKLSRSWEAQIASETPLERRYIQEEARRLFQKNKEVIWIKKLLMILFFSNVIFAHGLSIS